ncbi:hypothetical protein CF327_g5214 [Tilletia walkeri]|nr:hypothetical protein CF327_g5214 [Tilletia walkeri]
MARNRNKAFTKNAAGAKKMSVPANAPTAHSHAVVSGSTIPDTTATGLVTAAAGLAISSSSSARSGVGDQAEKEGKASSMGHGSRPGRRLPVCCECGTETNTERRHKYARSYCKNHAPAQTMSRSEALKHFAKFDNVKLRLCDIQRAEESGGLSFQCGDYGIKRYRTEELQIVWAGKKAKLRNMTQKAARKARKLVLQDESYHLRRAEDFERKAQEARLKAEQAKQKSLGVNAQARVQAREQAQAQAQAEVDAEAEAEAKAEAEAEATARQSQLGPVTTSVNKKKAVSQLAGSEEARAHPAGSAVR